MSSRVWIGSVLSALILLGPAAFQTARAAAVVVSPSGGSLLLNEHGLLGTYDLSLDETPAGQVEITASSADGQSELTLDGINFFSSVALTFADTAPQTVTLRAISDIFAEGLHQGVISHAVTSTNDPVRYPLSLTIDSLVATISESPPSSAVLVVETGGGTVLFESGLVDTYALALEFLPAGVVEVMVSADPQVEVSSDGTNFFSALSLSFVDTTPQTIYARAIADAIAEGVHQGVISHNISATGDSFSYPLSTQIPSVFAQIFEPAAVPEPPVWGLLLLGLVALIGGRNAGRLARAN